MAKLFLGRLKGQPLVKREGDLLKIKLLSTPQVVKEFIPNAIDARREGYRSLTIDISRVNKRSVVPNVLVPITAFCENLISTTPDLTIEVIGDDGFSEYHNFPYPKAAGLTKQHKSIFNRVWKFDSPEDVFKLVTEYIDEIYEVDIFEEKSILTAIEWCLNEVMDNVIQHADCEYGYVMGTIDTTKKIVSFCVADAGKGILESLKSSGTYMPKTATDAITLALREGVTRDKSIGQGNGLWGLHQIVYGNTGVLRVSSAGATIDSSISGETSRGSYVWLNKNKGGTVLDFQLDYSNPLSLKSVLAGYEPMSIKINNATNEDGTIIHYKLIDKKTGFGTRSSGERLRKELINLVLESGRPTDIDFSGVGVVSSSFADEFIGKLFTYFGPVKFNQFVRMTNMNDAIETIINKAMEQRLKNETDSL